MINKKLKRIAVTTVASVCAMSSIAAISANASAQAVTTKLSNGYTVKATLDATSNSAKTTFSVTNGGPTDLQTTLSISYKNCYDNDKSYKASASNYSTYLSFDMKKPVDLLYINKVEAAYYNVYITEWSNHTIGLYEYSPKSE